MRTRIETDMTVTDCVALTSVYSLIKLTPADGSLLPESQPGQFVQVLAPKSAGVLLRRPISINMVDRDSNELWLLVRRAGAGTNAIADVPRGGRLNVVFPLGNGFTEPESKSSNILLVGGGVGVAPLLYLGSRLRADGFNPRFLLGARSKADILELEMFESLGETSISTDDGSFGEPGLVTTNSVLRPDIEKIYCCGPAPMMKAVAAKSRELGSDCEVSLENMMACGVGACLCCVEKTVRGNVCVCTEGPVFNINELTWQI